MLKPESANPVDYLGLQPRKSQDIKSHELAVMRMSMVTIFFPPIVYDSYADLLLNQFQL